MISSLKMWIIRIPNFVAEASQVVNHKFLKLNASHFLVNASRRIEASPKSIPERLFDSRFLSTTSEDSEASTSV